MIKVHTLPAFHDNYLWLFHLEDSKKAYVVDPGDAKVVLEALESLSLDLAGIMLTHHHPDHTGGVEELLRFRSVPVFGPNSSHIPWVSHPFTDNGTLSLAPDLVFRAIEVPGHTLDHIAWYREATTQDQAVLFCGDTLFAGGCGRLFEGTAQQMHHSLSKLAALPRNTAVYCAHEYTLANLAFASEVEPGNKRLEERVNTSRALREAGTPTVPSTIGLELETNPFMRCHASDVKRAADKRAKQPLDSEDKVLACIREWKDSF